MHIVRFIKAGHIQIGIADGEDVVPTGHRDLRSLIEAGAPELDRLRRLRETPGPRLRPDRVLAPVAERCQLLFTGGNYADHQAEAHVTASEPIFFPKLWSAVIGPGDPIRIPAPDTHTDWEAELAVVIGKRTHQVSVDDALEYVFGYTLVNDVSARDVLAREPLQIMLCKSPDTFCPIGPSLVTTDELPDLHRRPAILRTRLNGELKQHASIDMMMFTIAEILSFLTRTVTLEPGDLVTTGTPGGTGLACTPPQFMKPGDTITVSMDGIGELTNPVIAGWAT